MGKEAKQGLTIFALLVAALIIGRVVYTRVTPSPELQEFRKSADEINKKVEEIKRQRQSP